MVLTKKHFVKIANILSTIGYGATKEEIVERFADFLGNENPRFDKQRFIEACFVNENKEVNEDE